MMLFDHIVGTVSFTQLAYTVYENNGTLQPELILSNPLSVNVTVEIDTVAFGFIPGRQRCTQHCLCIINPTALGEEDYKSGPHTVMIPGGNTRAMFNVTITDDNVFEPVETFRLVITQTSHPLLVVAAFPNQPFVTIRDDDRKFV